MYLYIKRGKIVGLFADKLQYPHPVDRIIELEVDKIIRDGDQTPLCWRCYSRGDND